MNSRIHLICLLVFVTGCDKTHQRSGATDELSTMPQASKAGAVLTQPTVSPALFLKAGLVTNIAEVQCAMSDGTTGQCYSITTNSVPSDHRVGPWCPKRVSDDASAGGIWPEGGKAHDVDGAFVKNLASFYKDSAWKMHNADGSINVTETAQECAGAARPDVDPALQNHCVECLPSYLKADAQYRHLVVKRPRKAARSQEIRGNIGVALNGVEFARSAPTQAILGAHTLAPFDDCGGHINMHEGYHYHAVTAGCLTRVKQPDGHAAHIGYAMDGFAIHEMHGEGKGEPRDLDDCRGHTDSQRGYHYHVSGAGENMIIGCWRGVTAATQATRRGPLPGNQRPPKR